VLGVLLFLGAIASLAATIGGPGWYLLLAVAVVLLVVGVHDLVQKEHTILRNYPILGHMRFLMEGIRPELQQYFIERNFDGRPSTVPVETSVTRYQHEVVASAMQIVASMGLHSFDELKPHMLRRRIDHGTIASYAEMFDYVETGELLAGPPPSWATDWDLADPDRFLP